MHISGIIVNIHQSWSTSDNIQTICLSVCLSVVTIVNHVTTKSSFDAIGYISIKFKRHGQERICRAASCLSAKGPTEGYRKRATQR